MTPTVRRATRRSFDVKNLDGRYRGSMDQVDRLVEAWGRERPDLDLSPMEVLSRVTRISHHLDQLRRGTFAEHDLEPWEFDVLAALRRAGAPYRLSPGRLVRETLETYSDEDLNRFVEEKAGNDLQWIRINGSMIGGIVGFFLFLLLNFVYDPYLLPVLTYWKNLIFG